MHEFAITCMQDMRLAPWISTIWTHESVYKPSLIVPQQLCHSSWFWYKACWNVHKILFENTSRSGTLPHSRTTLCIAPGSRFLRMILAGVPHRRLGYIWHSCYPDPICSLSLRSSRHHSCTHFCCRFDYALDHHRSNSQWWCGHRCSRYAHCILSRQCTQQWLGRRLDKFSDRLPLLEFAPMAQDSSYPTPCACLRKNIPCNRWKFPLCKASCPSNQRGCQCWSMHRGIRPPKSCLSRCRSTPLCCPYRWSCTRLLAG